MYIWSLWENILLVIKNTSKTKTVETEPSSQFKILYSHYYAN